jgi:hypothetical protein
MLQKSIEAVSVFFNGTSRCLCGIWSWQCVPMSYAVRSQGALKAGEGNFKRAHVEHTVIHFSPCRPNASSEKMAKTLETWARVSLDVGARSAGPRLLKNC